MDNIAKEKLGAMQIESPLLYEREDKEIKEQAEAFQERHYAVIPPKKNKEFILRFAGDFGLFKIMKQAWFSHRMLPLRIYEFSKSYRHEKSGELSGLRRLRGFHMPDIHSFCKDMEEGKNEYKELYKAYDDLVKSARIKYAIAVRVVKDYLPVYKEALLELAKYSGKPLFIEILPEMKHYWAMKHEFQAIDSHGKNLQLSTVQLDVKDSYIYGIKYVDKDGSKKGCIICHSSIGGVERWVHSLLENALEKKNPILPVWLSPSQVRLIPVSEKHIDYCKQLAKKLEGVRADIDDRNKSMANKIRNANKEWVPYVAVVGDKESESDKLMVSKRVDEQKHNYKPEELRKEIIEKSKDFPRKSIPLPKYLSLRPIFYG